MMIKYFGYSRVRCDQDRSGQSGPVLIFDFNLAYPLYRTCQSATCAERMFGEIYQQFQSVASLTVDFTDAFRELRLCSIGVSFNAGEHEELMDS